MNSTALEQSVSSGGKGAPTKARAQYSMWTETETMAGRIRVDRPQLKRELVRSWIPIAHEFFGLSVEILLSIADAFPKRRR